MKNSFSCLAWGFLFIMISFRIQGFDILPDTVGYILFAVGLSTLQTRDEHFSKALKFTAPMTVLSLFSIYQAPTQGSGVSVSSGAWGAFGLLLSIVTTILNLLVVYHICMGVKSLAERDFDTDSADLAARRWKQYLWLQLLGIFGALCAFVLLLFIPLIVVLFIGLFIFNLIMTVLMIMLMNRCGQQFT